MGEGDDDQANGGADFAALLAASEAETSQRPVAGELVRGRVIALGAGSAFVEIGGKGEAIIDVAEFRDPESGAIQLAVGDQLEATVVDDGRTSGTVVLKRTVGRGGHVPGELEQALAHGIAVEGVVTAREQGRLRHADRRRARVLPRLADRSPARRGAARTSASACASASPRSRTAGATSSCRAACLLEEEAAEQAAQTWERIQVGAVLAGPGQLGARLRRVRRPRRASKD